MRVVLISAATSGLLAWGVAFMNLGGSNGEPAPLYVIVLAALIPVIPLLFFEEIWKYEHYGFYAILLAIVFLQLGHLGEHLTQVIQLIANSGDVSRSHGVFGALDFEDVHFVWDTSVWIGASILIYKFPRNKWLWISWAFASLHEVEHLFLFIVVKVDQNYYLHGGLAGIMGRGGIIGSPLPRPYLHFFYNFMVVIPLLVGFWDQTRHAFEQHLKKALPDLSEKELVSTSNQLHRMKVAAGEDIFKPGEPADRLYIISSGEVEVRRPTMSGDQQVAILGPGQFFGELGLMSGHPHQGRVRATKDTELLALNKSAFNDIVLRSAGGLEDIEAAVKLHAARSA
jgi:hypothetical protein